jgi:four helix bundle protein
MQNAKCKMSEKVLEARTKEYARRIIRLYSSLPRSGAAQVLGHQLLRSGTSIGANYREGMRSRSKAEFIAKLGDSLKEASESEYWLELLLDESFLPAKRLQPLLDETREITAMLIASIKTARSR